MSNKIILIMMRNLITKKYYDTMDEAVSKLDVYYAMNRIDETDYAELVMLADSVYNPAPPVEPEPTEPEAPIE